MSMLEWAENEVKIASNGEDCYECGCYGSALKAYKSLIDDGHSYASFGITTAILKRLLSEYPLTPIEDKPESWRTDIINRSKDGSIVEYQCKRMSSLFKKVNNKTGEVTYRDVNRTVFVDYSGGRWMSGLADEYIDSLYPVTLPYYPTGRYEVYGKSFATTAEVGCFDTVYLEKYKTPDGIIYPIEKYYKETENGWVETDKEEYESRLAEYKVNYEKMEKELVNAETLYNSDDFKIPMDGEDE